MKIIGQYLYKGKERISLITLKTKLDLEINKQNLSQFEDYIDAFCFGFHIPTFKVIYSCGKIETDTFNDMQEAHFHFSQKGKIRKLKQI